VPRLYACDFSDGRSQNSAEVARLKAVAAAGVVDLKWLAVLVADLG
jgi:hypothetical protein